MSIENILRNRIEKAAPSLSPAGRRIASYLLERQTQVASMTTAELAAETQTSPATVVRFCCEIGFNGFSDLKAFLSTGGENPRIGLYDLPDSAPVRTIQQKVLYLLQNVMENASLPGYDKRYETIADVLTRSSRILIFGNGGSGCIARCAYDLFLQVGIRCSFISDPVFELLEIQRMRPGETIFMISHDGQLSNLYENLRSAKQAGVTTIGILGHERTPLVSYLDYQILVGDTSQDYFSSILAARAGELYAVSVLFSILTLRNQHMNRTHATYLSNFYASKCVPSRKRGAKLSSRDGE